MAKVKIGVYRLLMPQGQGSLLDVIKTVQSLPGMKRSAMIIDDPIRPRNNMSITNECCMVDFSRISRIDRIETGDIRGNEGQIQFAPDDLRPCRYTAVLFDQHSNAMYIHEGAGVGHTTVVKYLKAVGKLTDLRLEVVLHDTEALERLREKKHRSFKVRIAGLENALALKAQGEGDGAVLSTMKVHRSPNAVISLWLEDRQEGYLDNVLETAAALIGWNNLPHIFGKNKPVKEISIGDDEETENVVNLLDDRMCFIEEIKLDHGQTLTDAQRHGTLRKAFERYRHDLRRRYPVGHNDPP
ncbi:MAG TPA: hypothetical protein VHW09_24115 [Bryobacteraceae bacterium]|jgi:hypothetical protein|nr:hypothetical protein [Bryobacteraceae bacterium]